MASAEDYGRWIVDNQDKQGSPEFETVAKAYKASRATPEPTTRESRIASIPGGSSGEPVPAAAPSMMDRIKGVGEAALALGTAATGGTAGFIGGTLGAAAGALATGKSSVPGDIIGEQARRFTYEPRTETGREYVGKVGEALAPLAAIPPAQALSMGTMAGPALRPVTQAIANSPEAALVRQGASAVGRAITPTVRPEVARLASRALELNMPIRPDMLTDNRFARMMGEAFEKVPLSGSKDDARQVAFNRALGAEIGADRNAMRLTPDVFDYAMTQSGEKIGEIASKTPIPLDSNLGTTLTQRVLQSQRYDTADVAKIIGNYVEDLRDAAKIDGVIPGEQFRKINSQIGRQMRGSQNGDLKRALSDLQDELQDALTRNISSPEDVSALGEARRQYAIGKAIEPLVAKSKAGDVSPAGLMQAVTATKDKKTMMARGRGGDLGDIAKIGQLFLKEPQSSGTAERAAVYGGILGGAGYVEPMTAGGIFAGANAYNRAGPALTRGILRNQR